MTRPTQRLASGRRLARSAGWNLAGMLAPMLVAVAAIPLLINGMGKERFGLLTIIWMGVGYFSLFDLGLDRALTKMVSERLGRNEEASLGPLIWTSLVMLTALGLLGALLLILFSPPLVAGLLQVPETLHYEAIAAFRMLATGVPVVILTAGLVGLLEAHQRFGAIAAIRIPLGILTFAGPLITLQFSPSIAWATAALLLSRLVAFAVYYRAATSVEPALNKPQWIERQELKPLLRFGGWLTITNIVGPLMTYLDRFFIGAQLGLAAVAYYVTPYEVLSRMQVLPQAIMGVLFPAMAAAQAGEQQRLMVLYANGSKVVYWVMLPVTAGAFLLAPEALQLWLGDGFHQMATPVVRWLAAGWMINTLARPAFTVLQSTGRPDLVAKAQLVQLFPYLAALWWLAGVYGIAGVAAAWALRVLADTLILNALVVWRIPFLRSLIIRHVAFAILATLMLFGCLLLIDALTLRVAALLVLACMAVIILLPVVRKAYSGKQRNDL